MGRAVRGLAAILVVAACGGRSSWRPLRPGEQASAPAGALRVDAVLTRGALGYDAAWAGGRLATIELATEFELVVRDLGDGRTVRARLGPPDWDFVDVTMDGGGALVAVASRDGTVRVFDATSAAERGAWRLDAAATAVALSPDGRWLATGAASGVLCLRRTDDGALLQCVAEHEAPIASLAFTPGGEALASADGAGVVTVWEMPSLAKVSARRGGAAAHALAFSPDGHLLAISSGDGAVELWPWSGEAAASKLTTEARVTALGFTPDGQRLVSGGADGTVRLWDPATRAEVARVTLDQRVAGVAVSPAGDRVAVAAWSRPDLRGRSVTLVQLLYPW